MGTQLLETSNLDVFDKLESEVRSYCRTFTTVFNKARNAKLWDTQGNEYIDFFCRSRGFELWAQQRKDSRQTN